MVFTCFSSVSLLQIMPTKEKEMLHTICPERMTKEREVLGNIVEKSCIKQQVVINRSESCLFIINE